MSDGSGLTEFQLEVAQLFFVLPASEGRVRGRGDTPRVGGDPAPRPRRLRPAAGLPGTRPIVDLCLDSRPVRSAARTVAGPTRDELLSLAREIDDGFDDQVFAEMLESIARYPDAVIADVGASPPEVRESFADWARQLRS